MRDRTFIFIAIFIIFLLSSCNLPKDPRETLSKIKNHTIKVGYCDIPPFDIKSNTPTGIEPEIVKLFAESLNSKIEWIFQSETPLLEMLQNNKINMVICGLKEDSPWADYVAFSKPIFETSLNGRKERHVIAIVQGENAFLSQLTKFINNNQDKIKKIVGDYARH